MEDAPGCSSHHGRVQAGHCVSVRLLELQPSQGQGCARPGAARARPSPRGRCGGRGGLSLGGSCLCSIQQPLQLPYPGDLGLPHVGQHLCKCVSTCAIVCACVSVGEREGVRGCMRMCECACKCVCVSGMRKEGEGRGVGGVTRMLRWTRTLTLSVRGYKGLDGSIPHRSSSLCERRGSRETGTHRPVVRGPCTIRRPGLTGARRGCQGRSNTVTGTLSARRECLQKV
jgi:hypothetical protein